MLLKHAQHVPIESVKKEHLLLQLRLRSPEGIARLNAWLIAHKPELYRRYVIAPYGEALNGISSRKANLFKDVKKSPKDSQSIEVADGDSVQKVPFASFKAEVHEAFDPEIKLAKQEHDENERRFFQVMEAWPKLETVSKELKSKFGNVDRAGRKGQWAREARLLLEQKLG